MSKSKFSLHQSRALLPVEENEFEGLEDDYKEFDIKGYTGATLDDLDEKYDEENQVTAESLEETSNIPTFGAQVLYSKFTGAPTLDEHALSSLLSEVQDTPKEVNVEPVIPSLWSFKASEYESPMMSTFLKTRREYSKWYKASIATVIFTTQFGGALELIYISPIFSKMQLPPLLDATVWTIPVVFITFLTPFMNILASHLEYERITHFVMIGMSILGSLIFACLDKVIPMLSSTPAGARIWFMFLGFLAFALLDTANEMTVLIQNKQIQTDGGLDKKFVNQLSIITSAAKILAYFFGTLQALGVSFEQGIIPNNMDLCFLLCAILSIISLVLTYYYQTPPTKGYRGPISDKIKQLKMIHFLPPPKKFYNCSPRLKRIVFSHFFASAGVLTLSVYATLWVGTDVFGGNVRAIESSDDYKTFNHGMSTACFCLLVSSIISAFTKYYLFKATQHDNLNKTTLKKIYLGSLLIAGLAILSCKVNNSISSAFIVLAFSGFAFETFHAIPGLLVDMLEIEETRQALGKYRHFLGMSLFYAQLLMFLVVPLFFLLNPNRDDNLWGLLAAGSSILVGAGIGFFA